MIAKTSLKNVTIQYYFITYKGIHRIPSRSFPTSFPIQVYKIASNFRWVHHILCFSHPNDKSGLSCLFLFQGSNHCINLFLRIPDAGVFGKMGYEKKTMWFKLKKKKEGGTTLIYIYIYIISYPHLHPQNLWIKKIKIKKRLLTKDCCLAWEEILSRNYGMWRSSIVECPIRINTS